MRESISQGKVVARLISETSGVPSKPKRDSLENSDRDNVRSYNSHDFPDRRMMKIREYHICTSITFENDHRLGSDLWKPERLETTPAKANAWPLLGINNAPKTFLNKSAEHRILLHIICLLARSASQTTVKTVQRNCMTMPRIKWLSLLFWFSFSSFHATIIKPVYRSPFSIPACRWPNRT